MTLTEVMRGLEAKGNAGTAATYRRHGVAEPSAGVSYADLGAMAKHIGVDHALALELWATGVHDARILAATIADPEQLTSVTLRRWLDACGNYIVTDAVAVAAARAPGRSAGRASGRRAATNGRRPPAGPAWRFSRWTTASTRRWPAMSSPPSRPAFTRHPIGRATR